MTTTVILIAAVPILAGLLYAAARESLRGVLLTKPILSALFVATACSGPHADGRYFGLVLAGLILCLAGDVFLIFTRSLGLFRAGLASFMLGHVLYAAAFLGKASPTVLTAAVAVICSAASLAVFVWLKPYLGKMRIPVTVYMAVITVMVISAASLADNKLLPITSRFLVLAGAVLFYASDIFVARHRFVKKEAANRLVGLPLYYAGQFMIACSTLLL